MKAKRGIVFLAGVGAALFVHAQEWPVHGADAAGTRYSAHAQINTGNVEDLEPAWTYRTGEPQRRGAKFKQSKEQNVPIIAAGQLILCTPFNRIIALDPATGAERWVFDPQIALDLDEHSSYGCRGVAQWTDSGAPVDAQCRDRIVFGTNDLRIFAIDAKTGERCPGFGANGEIKAPPVQAEVFRGETQYLMAPAIIGNVAVFGSSLPDYDRADGIDGRLLAVNLRDGRTAWTFATIPTDPADPASHTWERDGASRSGGGNVWGNMAVDAARDLLFVPTAAPTADTYGGHRPGNNLYTSSLLALRGSTGELVWHFQIVHHDLWGWDVGPQPLLVDLRRDGVVVPIVVQNTKQGLVFVLNRETGAPIFPIEERAVPAGDVPGEWYAPTQPIPVKPAPLVTNGTGPDDAWGVAWFDRKACREKMAALDHGNLYTPPSLRGTLMRPWSGGGANWGGPAYDPERQRMIINTTRIVAAVRLVPVEGAEAGGEYSPTGKTLVRMPGTPYAVEKYFVMSPLGAPCSAPPWGGLTAVDLADGTIAWDVPLGSIERMLPVPLPLEWGVPNIGGPIATAGGVIFIAATFDQKFRAFSTATGAKLWETKLPAGAPTTPITYMAQGRQYVVLSAGGHVDIHDERGDYVIAYALPVD